MHTRSPRQISCVDIELRAWRPPAHVQILHEIATAALAENVGVVCWWIVGDGFRGSFEEVGEIVGDLFQLVGLQLDAVMDYDVVCGFCLLFVNMVTRPRELILTVPFRAVCAWR